MVVTGIPPNELDTLGDDSDPGFKLLNDVRAYIKRFCVFPNEHCLSAVTLWSAHAHMIKSFYTSPRLALLSPEPGSGKTRVLEVLDLLVPESMLVFSPSPASIFRTLKKRQVTLLFDEIDAIWSKKGKDDSHEDLRALLNAGYRSGATIPRCVGSQHDVEDFEVFCAVAMAGLGELPETIMTRSVIIKMRRRAQGETVEQFRTRKEGAIGQILRERLQNWAAEVGVDAGNAWPELPNGVEDRNAEIWEPLIAVADAAGGEWPEIARKACQAIIESSLDRRVSLGIRLLGDLKTLFDKAGKDKLSTAYLLDMLASERSGLDDDAPWADLYGVGINARKLAGLLRQYGVKSKKVRIDDFTQQGYTREDLHDTWQRYLPPSSAQTEQVEQTEQKVENEASVAFDPACEIDSVLDVPDVPDKQNTEREPGEDDDWCPKCGGEGCKHCEPLSVREA